MPEAPGDHYKSQMKEKKLTECEEVVTCTREKEDEE
jgi:hypothetical protein